MIFVPTANAGSRGDLKLCALTKPVRTVFELVRMHRLFEIFSTREDAIRALGHKQASAA